VTFQKGKHGVERGRLVGIGLTVAVTGLILVGVWQLSQWRLNPVAQGSRVVGDGFPKTIIDQSGRQVLLPHKPQRIVSVTLATDEILSALVEPSRLLAVTYLAADETISNVPQAAAKVPHTVHADAEQLLALQPDLIFVASYLRPEIVRILQDAALPVFTFQEFESVAAIQGNIRLVAQAVGEERRGAAVVVQMNARLQAVAEQLRGVNLRPRVLYLESGGLTAGAQTSIDDIITHAGGENVAATMGLAGMATLSPEQVVALNPDVMFTGGKSPDNLAELPPFFLHPALRVVDAVQRQRVFVLPRRYLSTISQHIVGGVESLARAMHPHMASSRVLP
jgi:iron complex transport system substrate-binding protein